MWNDFWLHSEHNHGVFEGSIHWPSTVNKSEVIGLSRREEAIRCTIHLCWILILLDKTFFYCGQSLKSWHLFLNTLALRKPMQNATAMQIREPASRWHAIGDSNFIRTLVRCDFVGKKCLSLFNLWDFRYVYLTNARFLEFKKNHNAIFKSFYSINMAPDFKIYLLTLEIAHAKRCIMFIQNHT